MELLGCTLIRQVEKNVLIEKEGEHISRTHWDIIKMYNEIIAPFHNIKSDRFSPGFYCHLNFTVDVEKNDFRIYLLNGLKEAIGYTIDKQNSSEVKYEIFRLIDKTIKGLMSDGTLWEVLTALYFRWTCLPDCAVPELDADYRRNNRRLS